MRACTGRVAAQPPFVSAVHPLRHLSARGTCRPRRARPGLDAVATYRCGTRSIQMPARCGRKTSSSSERITHHDQQDMCQFRWKITKCVSEPPTVLARIWHGSTGYPGDVARAVEPLARAGLGMPQHVLPPVDIVAGLNLFFAVRAHVGFRVVDQPRFLVLEAAGRHHAPPGMSTAADPSGPRVAGTGC